MKKSILTGLVFIAVIVAGVPFITSAQTNQNLPSFTTGSNPFSVNTGLAQNPTITYSTNSSSGACSNLTSSGLSGVVGCVSSMFNYAIYLMMAGAVVFTVYGAFLMLSSEEKRASGRQTVIYGIVGLFIMVSIWGLVNILDSTFNLTGSPISPPQLGK